MRRCPESYGGGPAGDDPSELWLSRHGSGPMPYLLPTRRHGAIALWHAQRFLGPPGQPSLQGRLRVAGYAPHGMGRPAKRPWLRAPLENRIPLLAGLDDFPDSFESGRHDERVACPKFVPLARHRFNANAALDEHAELVLGVTYSPLAAGAGP